MSAVDRYTCEQVFQRLDDYLDRELSSDEMRLVRAHLDACEACTREHRFERRLLDDVRAKLQRLDMPAGVLARIREAISKAGGESGR